MPPIYEPEVAADAIVWAASQRRREISVGGPTVAAIWGNKFAAGLLDRYLALTGFDSQQTSQPADPHRPNNLWNPLPGDHGAHGRFAARSYDPEHPDVAQRTPPRHSGCAGRHRGVRMGGTTMATRMRTRRQRESGDALKGAIAGIVAGLAGAWAMTEFQAAWTKAVDGESPQSAAGRHDAREWQERNEDQNATELAAQAIAERTIDRPLTDDELAIAAPGVHYGFGASMGAVYGALAEAAPKRASVATGAAFGTLIWIGGDEIAVPLFGLSKANTEYPLETHVQAWASHLVYGVTTELVRRGIRKIL